MAANTYGRQVIVPLTNKSGGGVIAGDVVVIDTGNNDAFTTTTSAASTKIIGIAQETIANNAVGRILTEGYAALVLTSASVTRGDYGTTHTVAKQAVDAGAARTVGTFCQFLTGGTTPDAMVFPSDLGAGSGIPATILDAAGDIIYASAADTAARLAAGASGTILKSAGVAAPAWAVGPNRHGCLTYFGGATQVVNNTFILFNTDIYDSDAYHDTSSNTNRITIPAGLGGVYLLEFGFYAASAAAGEVARVELNGTTNIGTNVGQSEDDFITGQCVYPLVATDYVWVAFYGNRTLGHASAYERQPHFSATLLGT